MYNRSNIGREGFQEMGMALTLLMTFFIIPAALVTIDIIGGDGEYPWEKEHKKLIGKEYFEVIKELYDRRGSFPIQWGILREMLKEYEKNPKEYYLYMLKYEYAFTLIKNMLDEAKDMGVEKDDRLIGKVEDLLNVMKPDYIEVRHRIMQEGERNATTGVTAINKQIDEEIKFIEEIRKMRGK